ncbi:DUF4006 domain-containing protein [Campylobacter lari]|uniref:DUF4006 family protein n=2 Tax=Campylobacter lari TaxID=201 RepID=A0A5L4JTA3_CAMLA|nr:MULTISPECIES: DUF4006 family protein [Campylobacter]MCR8682608.1 DUF4006 family protein [Campylobacter sp. LMG 17559]MCR8698030.1 DUF4006 family protein [Campylobacter sp. LMG 7929]MCR8711809.1 DUF4006 family protein [Campylobacter sp. W0066.1]AJD01275.1 hypothetical protein (DUF4006 domain) [Campylobacter lari NCTC 11845]AJD02956.1 hypothetical protein (DUF4006 domain) [Campylobacter lari CCUG 22395]
MENSNRCVFSLSGVSGMLIATVLLLSILAGLTVWGLKTQQDVMQKPYKIENAEQIKMFDSKREEHIIIKE